MKPPYLDRLLASAKPLTSAELAELIPASTLSLHTIQELKDYAAQFHFSQPAYAVQVAQQAHALSRWLAAPAQALGCWALGNAYLHNSQYVQAKHYLLTARTLYLAEQAPLQAARLSVGLVGVMAYTGQLQAAAELAAAIDPILAAAAQHEQEDLRRWAGLMTNCGFMHELQGDYEGAIAIYQRCSRLLDGSGETHRIARARHNHAYALVQIGAFTEALTAYQQAETLFNAVQSTTDLVRLYINRCHTFVALGRYHEAIASEEEIREQLRHTDGLAQALPRLTILRTQLYLAIQQPITEPIIAELRQAQATFAADGPLVEEGLTWLLLGHCYLQQAKPQLAQTCYQQALSLAATGADRAAEFWARHGLAKSAEQEGRWATAIELYRAAITHLERIRNDLQIELWRTAYLNDKLDVYRDLTALLIRQERLAEAFQTAEQAKARVVTEKLAARLTGEVGRAVDSENESVRRLAQQLQTALVELEGAYTAMQFKQNDVTAAEQLITVADREGAVHELIAAIQQKQAVFSNLTIGQTVTLAALQRRLTDSSFLQYHVIQKHFAVFVVTAAGIRAHVTLGAVADVVQAHADFTAALQGILGLIEQAGLARATRRLPALVAAANQHLSRLHTYLFAPIAPLIPAHQRLIISPDDLLHATPFQALFNGQNYLVEDHIISYAPNATILDACARRRNAGEAAFFIGYDDQRLGAVEGEVQTLARQFPVATAKVGAEATTANFLRYAPTQQLIHVAAHATFRRDKPMLSAITLSDRRLTLAEICRQHFQADLVTLSGCETGAGQIRGADVLSLATGFLGAGVRSLLVSLWRVEDTTTAQLMQHFYSAMQAGVSYAEALCLAQRALLAAGRQATDDKRVLQHPVFWAPFVLLGGQ